MATNSNVTDIESKKTQPACRFSIQATLRGFPITIEGEGRAGDLKIIVDRLFDLGAEPPTSAVVDKEPTKTAGDPLCRVHGVAMKPSRKSGKFYCTKRAEDGEYCRETA